MIALMVEHEDIARAAKGMLEETDNEHVGMGVVLLAAKLCFPDAFAVDRDKAVGWTIQLIEELP